jgi:multiple sugar transport system permease protein
MQKSLRKEQNIVSLFIHIGLLIGLVYAAFPIVWMAAMSLRPNPEIFDAPPSFIPKQPTAEAYKAIIFNPLRLRYFGNSYLVAFTVTFFTLIVSMLAAYSLSRFAYPGKKIIHMFIISTQTVPPITLLIPYFGMIVAFRIYNTYFALIFTYMALTLPYAVLMMTGYFNTIPKELDEAVLVDGGSRFYALWRVLVPISTPGIVATGIYTFLLSWNEFLFALTLTKTNEMRTVPVGIQQMMGEHAYQWNEMMAISILGSIPVLVFYLFAQNQFLAGMTAGSVKA